MLETINYILFALCFSVFVYDTMDEHVSVYYDMSMSPEYFYHFGNGDNLIWLAISLVCLLFGIVWTRQRKRRGDIY